MSDIDMGSNVDGIPVVLKKELRTQIFAKLDQTIAIAGLVENRQSRFTDSIPGLSALPGLGRLFESEDFKRNRSEAYVFVIPRLMKSPWLPSPEL
jgi:type II secretory pathway component GspD/PulD (secretin)